jgi:hypothetical protein
MKKITMTFDIIRAYHKTRLTKSRKFRPRYPFCAICSDLDHWKATKIKNGEECYAVDYTSGGTGYYHIPCIDNGGPHAEKVLHLDKDRWHGLRTYIHDLVLHNPTLKPSQVIQSIAERYKCGQTTAWRKYNLLKPRT